jgi:amino acid adenylation domain-containing protein
MSGFLGMPITLFSYPKVTKQVTCAKTSYADNSHMKMSSLLPIEKAPEGFVPVAEDAFEQTVVEYYEQIVKKYPEKLAIIDKESEISYRDFNSTSNQCARAILSILGDVQDEPILFLSDHTITSMLAIMGILKSGNIYVALDVSQPVDRLNAILEDSHSQLMITSNQHMDLARKLALSGIQILNMDTLDSSLDKENLDLRPNSKNLAVIFYTSGSTGKPKGVLLNHRALMERVATKINTELLSQNDRVSLSFPVGFGWSTQPVFGALLSGATLYVRSYNELTLAELSDWIEFNKISHLSSSASFFRHFLASLPPEGRNLFPHLRIVQVGGETFHPQDVIAWQKHFSDNCTLVYAFSSTEAGRIFVTFFQTYSELNKDTLPLGYLTDPIKLYILDEDDRPVGNNVVGQIAYRTPAMLRGYWRSPELNSNKFIPDPEDPTRQVFLSGDMGKLNPDGCLEPFGRKDTMVKIRGFRVDTTDVESALHKHSSVKNAIVIGWKDQNQEREPKLVAYLSLKQGETLSLTDLRIFMAKTLPEYMLPSRYMILKELPLNQNGKIDRRALPDPDTDRPDINTPYVPPQTELEKNICVIWQNVLNVDSVGIKDDFFELGGSSLIAIQMTMQVEKLVKKTVSPAFFQQPTIQNLIKDLGVSDSNKTMDSSGFASSDLEPEPIVNRRGRVKHTRNRAVRWRKQVVRSLKPILSLPYLPILRKPFPEGFELLNKWGSNTRVNRFLFPIMYKKMEMFLNCLGLSGYSIDLIMKVSIIGNLFQKMFIRSIAFRKKVDSQDRLKESPLLFLRSLDQFIKNSSKEQFDKYFGVEGLEFLEEARKNPHGVILLSYHTTMSRIATPALSRHINGQQIITISSVSARRKTSKWDPETKKTGTDTFNSALFASEALNGQHMLEEGKIIQLVSDYEYKNDGESVIIGKRKYSLRAGFAALALNTGATILPVYNTLTNTGQIHTIILPALKAGIGDRATQTQNLLLQYVKFMNSAWLAAPESLKWNRIQSHLKKQPAGK